MKYRYWILFLMVLLGVITFLDRVAIATAGPRMMEDLNISPSDWGLVLSSFVLSYSLFQIPLGALGDKWGQRWVLAGIVIWWSFFTGLTGLVAGLGVLLVVRFMFGVGEAGAYPCMSASIAKWFPSSERGIAQGFIWGASRAGGALAPVMMIPLMATAGWRAAFIILGMIGLVWGVLWILFYRDKKPQETAGAKVEVETQAKVKIPWNRFLRNPQFWLILGMYWFYVWGSWFYFSWLHVYLVKGRGLTEVEMGFAASAPFVLGMISNVLGGFASDYLSKKFGLKVGRRLIGGVCLGLSAILLAFAGALPGKWMTVALLAISFGVMDFMLPSAWALCLDVGKNYAGAISGAMNTAGNFGGFLCALLFGYVVEWFGGDYNMPLYFIAGMLAVSSFLFLKIDPTRELAPEAEAS
ncbi:MAG: MFS transporter [Opitutales bacterium]|nr:MFS transporter [Opitutales bacterium]